MGDKRIEETFEFLEYMSSGDAEIPWISPTSIEESRGELVDLYEQYITTDGPRIIDVACGSGLLTRDLTQKYGEDIDAEVIGIDFNHKPAYVNNAAYDNKIFGGDAFELLPYLNEFDALYSIGFVQATENPSETADLLYDTLKDDGYAFVTVPSDTAAKNIDSITLKEDDESRFSYAVFEDIENGPYTHTVEQYVFSEEEATTLFTDANFDIVHQDTLEADGSGIPQLMSQLEEPVPENSPSPKVNLYILQK